MSGDSEQDPRDDSELGTHEPARASGESAAPWSRRLRRPSLAIAGAVVALLLSFSAGRLTDNADTNVIDTSPGIPPIVVVSTDNGTLVAKEGEVAAVTGGTATPVEFRDQNVTASEVQRFTENVTSKSQELKSQVEADRISEEDAADDLAIYIGNELRELTDTPPTDSSIQTIKERAKEIMDTAQEELVLALVERLVNTLIGGEQPPPVPPPPTPSEQTSVERTSQ